MMKTDMRIGFGADVHQLVSGRELILGGEKIEYDRGLKGHSDADVLIHALCDAVLGAGGLGDIGEHFPDTDPRYRGISSLILLKKCADLIREKGYEISNADCVIFAQAPRMGPHKKKMEENMAGVLALDPDRVNVKATTTEGLGFAGRGEGIAAQCTVLIKSISG
ncbi:2-C-methyl-D-erythritol 2,4-cyclodiphosphate synthase [Desulfospira joergensenii]|uniref:2-C-methyl-D-erythritol 2,4-cyclodiphosphate synthase n=1 Tax=Desulfospira joergensenii TaxID=53329 RepID=UPI0003B33558|nr:2-C-methyl-D-erythritol 2,4-cyclodiphosphate synthase [Desulfospira joergensenii]